MSLPNYLAKIKSSGIYRFVWDKSEIAGVDAEILRLVVGYSEKGPFNTPIYVKSEAEFKSIFGDVSKKLEKRGAYFHRMAIQCLAKGPILALNLKKFSDEKVAAASFNVVDTITASELGIESVYDTTRFWKLDPESMARATGAIDAKKYISLSATDSLETSCSVIMRGYKPVGYDVTVANWYNAQGEEIPEYFKTEEHDYTNMLVSDFFAEIYVFRGQFTAAICAADPLNKYFDIVDGEPVLKEYFVNAFGEKVDTLPLLAADEASNLVNSYSGCLLPYFKNANGTYYSLDLLFNQDQHLHKMMMNLNSDLLFGGTIAPTEIATTCWKANENNAFGTSLKKTAIVYANTNDVPVYDADHKIIVDYTYSEEFSASEKAGHEPTCFEADFIEYQSAVEIERVNISGYIYRKTTEEVTIKVDDEDVKCIKLTAEKNGFMDAKVLLLDEDNNIYTEAGEAVEGNLFEGLNAYKITKAAQIDTTADAEETEETEETTTATPEVVYGYLASNDESVAPMSFILTDGTDYTLQEGDVAEALAATDTVSDDEEDAPSLNLSELGLVIGDRLLYNGDICTISEIAADKIIAYTLDGEEKSITSDFAKCNHSCSINNAGIKPVYFVGYEVATAPGLSMKAKLEWQKNILSALTEYKGMRLALTNRTDIDYRYIVDTFEAFVDAEVHKEIALICKEKDNALGFLNFPSAKTFRDCDYTKFTDQNGRFQVKYVGEGGNKMKNPSVLFSLVSEPNGASFVSYNTPLTFSDGTVKTYVPSAALVSNNFIEKYESRQPYYIVAGPTYGRMIYTGLVGPDFNYSRADLDILEPMGVNAMVYVPRLGTFINSNKTAKQNPKTALSLINVRELVIYLQDEIEKLLQDYQWEFNTQNLRDLIKAKADVICERVKNNGGIYEYLNVCDESNNTDDVIDNEMFVLSTSIEPGKGCGTMVQELTIYKKGGMSSLIK